MFKQSSNSVAVRQLLALIVELAPIPHMQGLVPRFTCAGEGSAMLVACNIVGQHQKITFIVLPAEGRIILCPNFFNQDIKPLHLRCPQIIHNTFEADEYGQTFSFGQSFDLISALLAVYTQTRCYPLGPAHNAIAVMNEAMTIKGPESASTWTTIAGYFLRKIPSRKILQTSLT